MTHDITSEFLTDQRIALFSERTGFSVDVDLQELSEMIEDVTAKKLFGPVQHADATAIIACEPSTRPGENDGFPLDLPPARHLAIVFGYEAGNQILKVPVFDYFLTNFAEEGRLKLEDEPVGVSQVSTLLHYNFWRKAPQTGASGMDGIGSRHVFA